jgi:hypothetical protein
LIWFTFTDEENNMETTIYIGRECASIKKKTLKRQKRLSRLHRKEKKAIARGDRVALVEIHAKINAEMRAFALDNERINAIDRTLSNLMKAH